MPKSALAVNGDALNRAARQVGFVKAAYSDQGTAIGQGIRQKEFVKFEIVDFSDGADEAVNIQGVAGNSIAADAAAAENAGARVQRAAVKVYGVVGGISVTLA